MKEKLPIILSLCIIATFFLVAEKIYFNSQKVSAQSSGSSVALLIGGTTEGVSDFCCNGLVLEFDSVNPAIPLILDGEAIFVPGISDSYDNGNEYSEEYNTLGKLGPGVCVTPDSECESVEYMPEIQVIGTSSGQSQGF
jgi:hypothetical protein